MTLALATLALLCVSTVSSAQAPRITRAGDPSVRDDSIFALAVDPASHPEETAVLLLDDGVIRLDADGRGTATYRMVTQILRPDDLDDYREMRFTWAPQHQRFTSNWVKVVRPDGRSSVASRVTVRSRTCRRPWATPCTATRGCCAEVESPFGVYRKTYSQTDRTLKVTRTVAGRTGVHPPEKITELIAFLRSLGADDASVIVITK